MSEFVNHYGAESRVVRGGEHVGVVDAPAAVSVGVGKDDDVLVGYADKKIVEVGKVERSEVAVGVERGEVGLDGGVAPKSLKGNAHIGVLRGGSHGHEVETVGKTFEWLVGKDGLNGSLCVAVKSVGLRSGIAFSHDGHIDFLFRVARLVEVTVGLNGEIVEVTDENVLRIDFVGKRHVLRTGFVGEQTYGYVGGVGRHREKKHIFKRAARLRGFFCGEPFLEKCGERLAVEHAMGACIAEPYFAVPAKRYAVCVYGSARPSAEAAQFAYGDFLFLCIARKLVVNAERTLWRRRSLG